MYPASNGDAFLIRAGRSNVLVDGGYAQTFDDHISHDLRELARRGGRLNLIIASHIDADHISGLIRFLSVNGSAADPKIVPIDNILHNSLRSLTGANEEKIGSSNQEILKAIRRRGHPSPSAPSMGEASEVSARQGSSLASLIHGKGYRWNLGDGTASIALNSTHLLSLPNGNVRVIGPTQGRLGGLLKWWKGQLRQMGYTGPMGTGDLIDDAFEFTCEHAPKSTAKRPSLLAAGAHKTLDEVYQPDTSITNSSSIAVIVELGGSRILMLADAWAEDACEALRALQSQGCSMVFDAIKISHHGSLSNTSPELLRLVDAPKYLVSSSGVAHDHPDIEVLAAIVDRPASFSRALYLNYSTPASRLIQNHRSRSGAEFTVHENATDWIELGGDISD